MTSPTPIDVTLTLDKTSYSVGDPITATVEYSDGSSGQIELTVTATVSDPGSGATGSAQATAQVSTGEQATLPVSAQDSFGGDYSVQSNANGTAVLTGTVVTPPATP